MSEHRGVVLDDSGVAINGATVELFDIDTTTPVRATTTSDASGLWSISHSTRGRFDKKITNGSDIIWLRARDRVQFSVIQVEESVANQEALIVTRTEDVASVEVATFEGDRATPADGDLAYIQLKMSDSAGNQDEQARLGWSATTVASGATQDGDLILSVLTNGALTEYLRIDGSTGTVTIPVDTNLILGAGGDALIGYDGTNMIIEPRVVGSGDLILNDAASLLINETANANMTVGVTINQGASDDQVLAFKSSDVSHGMTSGLDVTPAEVDDYAYFAKTVPGTSGGGLTIIGLMENVTETGSIRMNAVGGTATAVKTTSGLGLFDILVQEHDGANALANIAANGNVFSIRARVAGANVTRFMVDEDGDLFAVNATITALDAEDDVGLIRAFERSRAATGLVVDEWDDFVHANEDDLIRVGVLGGPSSEGGMWNVTQHIRLINGAIWQQAKRIMALEQQLAALPEGR